LLAHCVPIAPTETTHALRRSGRSAQASNPDHIGVVVAESLRRNLSSRGHSPGGDSFVVPGQRTRVSEQQGEEKIMRAPIYSPAWLIRSCARESCQRRARHAHVPLRRELTPSGPPDRDTRHVGRLRDWLGGPTGRCLFTRERSLTGRARMAATRTSARGEKVEETRWPSLSVPETDVGPRRIKREMGRGEQKPAQARFSFYFLFPFFWFLFSSLFLGFKFEFKSFYEFNLIQMHTVGGLLRSRRSHKKKHLRKIDTEAKPKLPIRELRSVLPDAPT
jgi:hypothetical protein